MYSKVLPWDFDRNFFHQTNEGIHFLLIDEIGLQQFYLKKWSGQKKIVHGSDITESWIEENIGSFSFFNLMGDEKINWLILDAENISDDLRYKMTSGNLVFVFNKWNKKNKTSKIIHIIAPPFWEKEKYFLYFVNQLSPQMDNIAKKYLYNAVEPSVLNWLNVINKYNNLLPISAEELKLVFPLEVLDHFDLINLYHKDRKQFAKKLASAEWDLEWWISFVTFMQSHLYKILNPEKIMLKDKKNKYDDTILFWSSKKDLHPAFLSDLSLLLKIEVFIKKKDIQFKYLTYLYFSR